MDILYLQKWCTEKNTLHFYDTSAKNAQKNIKQIIILGHSTK